MIIIIMMNYHRSFTSHDPVYLSASFLVVVIPYKIQTSLKRSGDANAWLVGNDDFNHFFYL